MATFADLGRIDPEDDADLVARFLDLYTGRSFCHTCLAARVALSFERVRKAVAVLRLRPAFQIGVGKCWGCGRERVLVAAGRER